MQYYNILFFIQMPPSICVLWICGYGGLGSETVDLIYVVGTRVTVKLCPDVAKIQSLKKH